MDFFLGCYVFDREDDRLGLHLLFAIDPKVW